MTVNGIPTINVKDGLGEFVRPRMLTLKMLTELQKSDRTIRFVLHAHTHTHAHTHIFSYPRTPHLIQHTPSLYNAPTNRFMRFKDPSVLVTNAVVHFSSAEVLSEIFDEERFMSLMSMMPSQGDNTPIGPLDISSINTSSQPTNRMSS